VAVMLELGLIRRAAIACKRAEIRDERIAHGRGQD
jgi:hypothetical protein